MNCRPTLGLVALAGAALWSGAAPAQKLVVLANVDPGFEAIKPLAK